MTLHDRILERAIRGSDPVGPDYATAVFVYVCRSDLRWGIEVALMVGEYRDQSFEVVEAS